MGYIDLISSLIENRTNGEKGVTLIKSEIAEEFIPYREIYRNACKYLKLFQEKGIKQGEEVLYQVEDIEKFIYIFWACQLGGITAVPVDIGENDENNIKVFRIWDILNKPHYLSDTYNMSMLNTYNDPKYSKSLKEMNENFIDASLPKEFDGNGCDFNDYKEMDYIALIQFSSGSTGVPKGIPIKYSSLYTHVNALARREEVTSKDVTLNWAPLSHNLGLVSVHLVSTLMGINQYIMPKRLFVNNPILWIDKASEHKATMIYSPNFGFKYFLTAYDEADYKNWDLSNIRIVFNGAEPINYDLCKSFLKRLERYGLGRNVMYPAYGCSESTSVISIPKVGEELKGYKVDRKKLIYGETVVRQNINEIGDSITLVDVGYPVENCEVRVCDKNNNILKDFQVGDLQVRGSNVISNYYNNEDATKESFLEDGWFITGDLCFRDKERIIITGRAKEIIFIGGQNYYPYDIERVTETADERLSGKIAACGIFNEDLQTDEICIFLEQDMNKEINEFILLAEKIKSYVSIKLGLYVGKIIPVLKLEKTDSGKLQRLKLEKNYLAGNYNSLLEKINGYPIKENITSVEMDLHDEVQSNLLKIWKETLVSNEISIDDNFFDLGGSSNLLIVMTTKLEKLYKDCVSVTDIFEAQTIRKLTALVVESIEKQKKIVRLSTNKLPPIFINHNKEFVIENRKSDLLKINLRNYPYFCGIDQDEMAFLVFSIYTQMLGNICMDEQIGINFLNKEGNALNISYIDIKNFTTIEELMKKLACLTREGEKTNVNMIYDSPDADKVITIISLQDEYVEINLKFDILIWIDRVEKSLNIKVNDRKINIDTFRKFVIKITEAIEIVNQQYQIN